MLELTHYDFDDAEEFLAHHGVKGMKWGRRTGGADEKKSFGQRRAERKAEKARNAALDDAHRQKTAKKVFADAKKEKNEVIAARMRTYSGANTTRLKEAKAKYQEERITKGKAAAKAALRAVKQDVNKDWYKSQELADGHEAFESLMADISGNTLAFRNELQVRNIMKYHR